MKYLSLATIGAVATVAYAQTLSTCIVNCVTATCPNGVLDLTCICTTASESTISGCITSNCSTADQETAGQLASACIPSNSTTTASGVSETTLTTPIATITLPSNVTQTNTTTIQTPSLTITTSSKAGSSSTKTAAASSSTSGAASAGNIVIGKSGIAGVLALAVALAVTVGIVA